ncbi:hypothetical protein ES332_D09G066900v1 [Gossypium tomentosum]|uniref:Uncharacterized protein n=1 Tax=Gossypium tomentosum TaxID=34277 RepID=A0A5D2JDT6_GOSTO|nr:hypothetical protein ES332_D09G066900v1 [Gossypium tomentosum]
MCLKVSSYVMGSYGVYFCVCRLMISSLSVKMSWHYIDNVLKRGQSSSLLKCNMQMHDWNVMQLMNVHILASEVIGLEEKALRLRSNELKLERQLENSQAEISSFNLYHWCIHQLVLIVRYYMIAMNHLQCIALEDTLLLAWEYALLC